LAKARIEIYKAIGDEAYLFKPLKNKDGTMDYTFPDRVRKMIGKK